MDDAKTIAWVLPHEGYDDEALLAPLRAQGYRVVTCLPGASGALGSDLRVLQAELFADARRLRREYVLDPRPTLVVVGSAEQEVDVLEFIKPGDDVVRGTQPAELLVLRLLRLARMHGGGELPAAPLVEVTDALTGLGNRRRWLAQAAQAITPHLPGEARAVVVINLDRFKSLNDRHGHAVGDQVLRGVAAALLAETAPGDRLARLGGDQFVALIARYDRATVEADVQRMLERLARGVVLAPAEADAAPGWGLTAPAPIDGQPQRMGVTASAGLAFVDGQASVDELLQQADVALYEAKSRGRQRLVLYESLQQGPGGEERDPYLRHFENVTRVMTERVTTLVTNMGRNLVEAARREANQDALTQLPNRRYFDARLLREIEAARRHGRALSVALIDLDHFHDVNAGFGYPTGDLVLRRFADVARASVRLTDWVARYGGEEFCLVMPDTELATAAMVAERLRRQVEATAFSSIDQRPVPLTASIGVAALGEGAGDPVALVERASAMLLTAKAGGRNRLVSAA
ncbi:MAG: GGDEF domain-containing protein [Piscinibacter sp.]|uniref:GGDEF domain-containing protein n=1 Tax=Piscinibacter sp. TaxID=1903157 RepID=UPI00258A77E4|nr:GGDEF domain-containing protein [Piscinibacter sp.]MCW5664700.1 GGDEF domain-containing protein [Piscinibacter sp.]